MKKIDLHIHTLNSDGAFSTAEVLKMCEEKKLDVISITDHYNIDSYYDIKNQGLTFNGKLIVGVELSFVYKNRLFDVLGYGFDLDKMNEWIEEKYGHEKVLANQRQILKEMKELYTRLGIKFDNSLEITQGKKSEAYNLIKHSALSFEENKKIAPELFETAFYKKHHTNTKSKYYINETSMTPSLKECLDIIHSTGGISSLAHSGAYGFEKQEMIEFIQYAIDCGVQGLELKYNCHTEEHEKLIKQFAKKHNLILTGGSDFHGGKVKPEVKLGKVYGDKEIYENEIQLF